MNYDTDVEGIRRSPMRLRSGGVLAGAQGTPSVPIELWSKELGFERKGNEGELRKNMTRLDGLSTNENCVR